MRHFEVKIGDLEAKLEAFLHEKSSSWPSYDHRPCIVICPGGGYGFLSDREMDPVSLEWLAQGYQVFVMHYSVAKKAVNDQPLKEIAEAIGTIRSNANEWGIDSDKIAVLGFSAGAHLSLSLGTMYDSDILTKGVNYRPDALILCYPVVSAGQFVHCGSFENLTGGKDQDKWEKYSLEKKINSKTPPCFIWHTLNDELVPVQNTMLLVDSLIEHGVMFELHIYPSGAHGLSMCTGEVCRPGAQVDKHPGTWFSLSCEWLNQLFDFKK
ncbi:alpha/beta hydrolase [Enterocloster clostridioformis]|uniref:Prolyl oligopeptidase family protein n=1 Tax=Enterocloster clostridioformis TaxID=1531 RepID=A0A1I0JD94_9FIRM|nr:alpha/beta hydrolase [Enterocloster clostridioformis]SEU08058.1 Prolyl oligopeptidase family protein [Enterocloster clostridioformis]SEW45414.1 Prolyl oligopeptidase family protein [Enterocloster clostridioformis]